MEESCLRSGDHERKVGCFVGEIWAHFRDEMEREREGIENGGNERGGAAEGFSDYVVVVEEDVVGVISDDETTVVGNGFGICDHDDVLWVCVVRIHARRRKVDEEFYVYMMMVMV